MWYGYYINCFSYVGLLDDYDALVSAAIKISALVKPLKDYLFKFNLTWDCFIKKLYQIYVYNDGFVQKNLPTFIDQVKLHVRLEILLKLFVIRQILMYTLAFTAEKTFAVKRLGISRPCS